MAKAPMRQSNWQRKLNHHRLLCFMGFCGLGRLKCLGFRFWGLRLGSIGFRVMGLVLGSWA